jgi:predicted dehydrogenase
LIRYLACEDYRLTHVSKNGLLLIAETPSGASINLEMNTNHIKSQWDERFTVCFGKGEIELDLPAPMHRQMVGRVRVRTEGEKGRVDSCPFLGSGWAFADQADLFVKTVRGEHPLISPASDAVKDLRIAEDYIRMMRQAKA